MDDETPSGLFEEVTDLKSGAPALEVFIAIGGWTFSDNGTVTQPLLGEISADPDKRQQFADNLVNFMTKYGFDGVDIDWEYPGAPDRGGKEEDTENFVLLMKTLKETYWYLQYFDVPALLKYADWTNLMSYDLHGVWDANNEIGSIIHGHTNLTEINMATDLLWRNNVAPGQVVLGTGFYGRSFELEDPECSKPGCAFSGPAKAGRCTGEGGILGYFEIQDILEDDDSIEKIHDEDAAVNYFTFKNNQWVSYDDKKTFQQKVDWADDLGLGGLMVWAVDLDDERLTAMSGLLGKDVGDNLDLDGIGQIGMVIDDWSSQNGQNCFFMECGEKCEQGTTEIDRAQDRCDDGEHRKVCCPPNNTPSDCSWRGGEDGRICDEGCKLGELNLFSSSYGDKECTWGKQQFCCSAPGYEDLVGSCEPGDCGSSECPSGKVRIDDEVAVMEAKFQDAFFCQGHLWTTLCCNVADNSFLPVDPEQIFPEVPPDEYEYEIGDVLTGDTYNEEGPYRSPQSFGLVIISGPPDVVNTIDKRDGSHMSVLSCDGFTDTGLQKTRIACMNDGEDSNCDDILLGGLEGTIVKMPENCGPGQYAVARSLEASQDQSIPDHVLQHTKRESKQPVMDLTFDYNFKKIKRADEKVYIRIDFSNVFGYYQKIINDDPVKSKRSPASPLMPRFYSENEEDWQSRFEELTEDQDDDYYTEFESDVDELLYGTGEKCDGSDDQFLDLKVGGKAAARAKWGFSLVGTLVPFNIEEVYSFTGAAFDIDLELSCQAYTGLDIAQTYEDLWSSPLTLSEFSHAGLISLSPSFQVGVGLEASDVGIVGDFTANIRGGTDGYLWSYYPRSVGGVRGQTRGDAKSDIFDGDLKITNGALSVNFQPRFELGIRLDNTYAEESESTKRDGIDEKTPIIWYGLGLGMLMGFKADLNDITLPRFPGYAEVFSYGGEEDIFPDDDDEQVIIGTSPGAIRIGSPSDDPDPPSEPEHVGFPVFGGFDLLECSGELDDEPGSISRVRCLRDLTIFDEDLLEDGGEPSLPGTKLGGGENSRRIRSHSSELTHHWDRRGNPRDFWVVDQNGNRLFRISSLAYPSIGQLPFTQGDPLMAILVPQDCDDPRVTEDGDVNLNYVTEHIFELQSVAQFLSFTIHGNLPNGQSSSHASLSQRVLLRMRQDYSNWGGNGAPGGSALGNIFNAMGSRSNTDPLIACEEQLNAIKARLWGGISPIADDRWRRERLDSQRHLDGALTWLRNSGAVFSYLEADPVQTRLQGIIGDIRDELVQFQDVYNNVNSGTIDIVALWDEWIRAFFEDIRDRAGMWTRRRLGPLLRVWQAEVASARRRVQQNPSQQNQATLEAAEENLERIEELSLNLDLAIDSTEFFDFLD
ncbi:hypothetical protein FQN54_009069 [Arachnomyces sp. PD_36]|nr:hypothetical protein FQN54_009069 [Arachnomyces sp. PD_36]